MVWARLGVLAATEPCDASAGVTVELILPSCHPWRENGSSGLNPERECLNYVSGGFCSAPGRRWRGRSSLKVVAGRKLAECKFSVGIF